MKYKCFKDKYGKRSKCWVFRLRKNLLDYTNSFSSNDYKKDDAMIYKCFKDKNGRGSKYYV